MLDIVGSRSTIDVGVGLGLLLDQVAESIAIRDDVALSSHLAEMHSFRLLMDTDDAVLEAQRFVRNHSVFPQLLEDPYTRHAYTKPRRFAGDASLIDLFYGHRSGWEAKTETGRFVFETLMRSASCDAVRFRRGYYGSFLDRIASKHSEAPHVLALACGHLREASFSRAVTDGAVRLVGLDSDPLAVSEAQRCLSSRRAELRNASVIDFVRRRAWGETYDAIYAAGLFDYLDDRVGQKVLSTAFEALRPGGTISVANFLPTIAEQGYMDLVMDWRLIYRTPDDMLGLAAHLAPEQASTTVWVDPLDTVTYLTITKRG